MADETVVHALNLLRRMPPSRITSDLAKLTEIVPDAEDDLLEKVDQPLKTETCAKTGRSFLKCDYNRDEDSFRSPWSNEYQPPIEDDGEEPPFKPEGELRNLEVLANELFEGYRRQYFGAEHGTASVYLWDQDDGGIAGCWVLKKDIPEAAGKHVQSATWDAVHVVEAAPGSEKWTYRLTSTIMLRIKIGNERTGVVELSGALNRRAEERKDPIEAAGPGGSKGEGHIVMWGRMIERMETEMRDAMNELYIAKVRDALSTARRSTASGPVASSGFVADLSAAVKKHKS